MIKGGTMVKLNDVQKYNDLMVEWRRDFHMYPETGFKEYRTSKVIIKLLESFGIEVVKIEDYCETAVVGIIDTGKQGPVIGLRADIDALDIQDNKEVEYKSKIDGVCHACGHDGHTAILLGVAKYFSENKEGLTGKLKFLFQPAEEGPNPGGAKLMLDSGITDDIDVMLGAHTHVDYDTGKIIIKYDDMFASVDDFDITLNAKGGHGAYPHQTTDVMNAASTIISNLFSISGRNIDAVKSGVVSIGYIDSGDYSAKNVIPDKLMLGGTVRTLDKAVRDEIVRKIELIANSAGEMFELDASVEIDSYVPVLTNNNEITKLVYDVSVETLGESMVEDLGYVDMGGEDFAFFSQKIPSCYFYFGVKNDEKNCNVPFHNSMYDMDEDSMVPTMSVFINFVFKYINYSK